MNWAAQAKQEAFLCRQEYQALYGGAAGGGKTDALLMLGILVALKYPGCNVLYMRRTYADLNKPGSAIPRSRELLHGRTRWNDESHSHTFAGNSTLTFGHLQNASALYDYQGAQIDLLLMDELTQLQEFEFDFMATRVRATVDGIRPRIRAATNPGNIGHGWVRRRFVDRAPWGEPFDVVDAAGRVQVDPVSGKPHRGVFIPARVEDNPALMTRDPGYRSRLELLPEALKRAYLEGDWDIFAGQVFSEWRRDLHVCQPFLIPPSWPRWRAVDYGYNAPMCCLWFARSPDGQVYVYRELYETQMRDSEQAIMINGLTGGELVQVTYADPSMWTTQPNGTTIAAAYAAAGVWCVPANNDRLAGWQRVHAALSDEPVLQVFETCQNLIRTLPALTYSQKRVEDVDTDSEDHAPDALRYGLMGQTAAQANRRAVGSYGYSRG